MLHHSCASMNLDFSQRGSRLRGNDDKRGRETSIFSLTTAPSEQQGGFASHLDGRAGKDKDPARIETGDLELNNLRWAGELSRAEPP